MLCVAMCTLSIVQAESDFYLYFCFKYLFSFINLSHFIDLKISKSRPQNLRPGYFWIMRIRNLLLHHIQTTQACVFVS